ncbi:glutathione S-transferase [Maricaulis sp.]|uniref:glutathione S-transferase family protein n=1 Tax=Maricaulis sp. TaxID=1486257 RepID=UPI0025BE71FA|nr:glutathione S-transferase [Maricaulis sp.]
MITVHHLNNSRSQRVLWLLEEIGLDYEIKKYERDPTTMRAPKALRDVHPLGKSPVISDGEIVVAESGAIIEYLVDTYAPALKPEAGSAAHREYVYWMHFAEGSLMTPLLVKLLSDQIGKAKAPFFFKPVIRQVARRMRDSFVTPELDSLFGFIESSLGGREWIAGDAFSGADVQLTFPLEAAAARGGLDSRYPNLQAYVARMHARPAYKAAIERGGAYGIVGS